MVAPASGYGAAMSEQRPERRHELGPEPGHEVPDGARPSVNQPLNAEPRPRVGPGIIVAILLAIVVVVLLALTLL
jgi:hypothetical protein